MYAIFLLRIRVLPPRKRTVLQHPLASHMSTHALARAGCARRRTIAWLTAMYPGSRALSCRVLSSQSCHVTLRRITTRPGAAALDRQRYGEATEDRSQRDSCGAGAKGIDDRGRGVRLQ